MKGVNSKHTDPRLADTRRLGVHRCPPDAASPGDWHKLLTPPAVPHPHVPVKTLPRSTRETVSSEVSCPILHGLAKNGVLSLTAAQGQ